MNQIDLLLQEYEKQVSTPWAKGLSGAEKVWFLVYAPADERRIRLRIGDFEAATRRANHGWHAVDLTPSFSSWMVNHEYREAYFQAPEKLKPALPDFTKAVAARVSEELRACDESTIVAVTGVGTLFGLTRLRDVMEKVHADIRGRLLVLFPGSYEGKYYRIFDARDGWDYLAIPITAYKGADRA